MTLRYTITPVPNSGTFHIELGLSARDELLLRLPAWLPGSYMIRDMAAEIPLIAAKSIKAPGAYSWEKSCGK